MAESANTHNENVLPGLEFAPPAARSELTTSSGAVLPTAATDPIPSVPQNVRDGHPTVVLPGEGLSSGLSFNERATAFHL
jgi:hypothetical protein